MAHDHHHHDKNTYYLDQLFSVAVCGALAMVVLLLYFTVIGYDQNDTPITKIWLVVAPKFHIWALIGAALLMTMVVIRAVSLWYQVDEDVAGHSHEHGCCDHDHAHDHGHDHDHAHDHEHGVCSHEHVHGTVTAPAVETAVASLPVVSTAAAVPGHDHDHTHEHGHDHGWAPWRYVILMLPVILYFLNLPNKGFSGQGESGDDRNYDLNVKVADRGRDPTVGFLQLEQAALTPERRAYYEGKTVRLTGHYKDLDTRRFTLIRYKMNCCAADAIPVKAVIFVDPAAKENLDSDLLRNQWVEVTGRVVFLKQPGTNEYATALVLSPPDGKTLADLVKIIPMDPNPWLT
jgi:hypothetical protein